MFEKYLTKTGRLSTKQPQDIKNQWYIQKFQEVHGNTYDYSKVLYVNSSIKVEIICKEHGSFWHTPGNHLNGKGCPQCQGNKQKDTKQCIEDFIKVHGNTYDYSNVVYLCQLDKVEIVCKEHGVFTQTPTNHLSGKGCPKCQDVTKTTQQCIEDFKKVLGDTYDYSKVQYINYRTKVEILCKEHGAFYQRPGSHISGSGCPKCQNHNQDTLYVLKCLDTGLIKIGITNNLSKRITTIVGSLEYVHHVTIENPRDLERELHKRYQKYNKFNPTVKNGGTEFFDLTDQQLQEIIEYVSTRPNQ